MNLNDFSELPIPRYDPDAGPFWVPVEGLCKWIVPTVDMVILMQRHEEAPVLGDGAVLCVDADGCVSWESVRTMECEASYSSKYFVRSTGGVVTLRFNPSRFAQLHSLDGIPDMRIVLELANRIVRFHGLPEFSEAVETADDREARDFARKLRCNESAVPVSRGVRLSSIHVCWCFFVAADQAMSFVAQSSVFKIAHKFGALHPSGTSCVWGRKSSRYWYAKLYVKWPELKAHNKDAVLGDLVEWSRRVGLLRHEVELYSRWLNDNGLEKPSAWSRAVMADVLKKLNCWQSGEISRPVGSDIAERLIALGVKSASAHRAADAYASYCNGVDVFASRSKATAYRLRKVLLMVGVDIAVKPAINVVRLQQKPVVFDVRPAYLPERFWRKEIPPMLKLVTGPKR